MAYFVKVIPPSGPARVHSGDCKFCRDGQGMENQDKGTGPTYGYPKHPEPGLLSVADADNPLDLLLDLRQLSSPGIAVRTALAVGPVHLFA